MTSSFLYSGWGLLFTAGVRNMSNCRQTFLEGLSFPGLQYPSPLLYIIYSKINLLIVLLHSSDPLLGLLLLRGAGGHGGVAVGRPSHPPPHTWTEPLIWLEGDTSSGMTSLWTDPTQTEPAALPKTAVTHHRLNKKKKHVVTFLLSAVGLDVIISSSERWRGFLPEDEKSLTASLWAWFSQMSMLKKIFSS